jgi:hypothetical protein
MTRAMSLSQRMPYRNIEVLREATTTSRSRRSSCWHTRATGSGCCPRPWRSCRCPADPVYKPLHSPILGRLHAQGLRSRFGATPMAMRQCGSGSDPRAQAQTPDRDACGPVRTPRRRLLDRLSQSSGELSPRRGQARNGAQPAGVFCRVPAQCGGASTRCSFTSSAASPALKPPATAAASRRSSSATCAWPKGHDRADSRRPTCGPTGAGKKLHPRIFVRS